MKFLHIADLHLGKSIHGVSLLDNGDQPHWVEQFLSLVDRLRPDAVLMAGDIYDRGAPSGEAVQLLSRLLTALAGLNTPVLMTAGNHDSVQRLSFAAPLLARQGVYISRPLTESLELTRLTLQDKNGPVTFYLLPYLFPALAAQALEDDSIRDYDTAVRRVLAAQPIDFSQRNVIVAHQNVTANGKESQRGGSESMVGGVGQVDYTAFDGFEYAALGHIHAAYPVGRPQVRYAGSPLCYHFDELRQPAKGPVLVTLGPKGEAPALETLALAPLHPLREIKGPYGELRQAELSQPRREEYLRVVLTDQRVTPEAAAFFRDLAQARGSVLMELTSEYRYAPSGLSPTGPSTGEERVESLFSAFMSQRTGIAPQAQDEALLAYLGELTRQADAHQKPDPAQIQRALDFLLKQEDSHATDPA